MADEKDERPVSKLTRSKQRWAREGRFLTGKTSRPEEQRLPPGQHLTKDWPTLDLGLTPNISRERWRLDVYGAVEHPIFWDFAQFTAQPQTQFTSDIHCVTTWSRYDNQFEGLATRALRRVSSCFIPMTATPPISRWKISPPRTHCSRIAGRASRWSRNMAG